jgi:HEAT repeat protein
MRALVIALPAAALSLALLSGPLCAHGGVWRPVGGGPTQPGGAGAPTTPGGGGPATAGGRKASSDLDRWEAWWYFQREAYLPRHTVARHDRELTSAAGSLVGRGNIGMPPTSPLLPEETRATVLPVLLAALKDGNSEIVDAAAIALGRSVETDASGPFLDPLEKTLGHKVRSPQQAAALALGMLAAPEAAAVLREVVSDSTAGRAAVGVSGPVDELLRGLAALALGFCNDRESVALLAKIARAPESGRDLAGSAVLGIGLHQKQSAFATVELVKLLEDVALDREVRAQVPIALQRLDGARALLPKMLELFKDPRTQNDVARSLAIALGNVALPEEAEVVEALLAASRHHDDPLTRHFAILALGRLFERAGPLTKEGEALRAKVHAEFLTAAKDASRRSTRPYAALALALIGRGEQSTAAAAGGDGKTSLATAASIRVLNQGFLFENDPSLRGAFTIALGLIGATESAKALRIELESTQIPQLRGHLATALALMHDEAAVPKLRELLEDRSVSPELRIDAARALGMLGDRGFEPRLIELLGEADDIPRAAAFAKALGLLGSRRSADSLIALAQRHDLPNVRRAFAIVALGLLAEKSEQPWNVRYLIDANFTTPLRPLMEVFDIL